MALLLGGLQALQVGVETVEASLPEVLITGGPVHDVPDRPSLDAAVTPLRIGFETAGRLMSNGSASAVTEHSPSARRARMARRVGSASAAKVRLSESGDGM
jgi:hypothetical protein